MVDESEERDKNRGLSHLCQMCPSCKYCREERPRRLLKRAQSYSQEERQEQAADCQESRPETLRLLKSLRLR